MSDRVLVTGASGFTGGVVAAKLARRGLAVRGLVRDAGKCSELTRLGVELAKGDLTDAQAIDRAVAGCRLVYHVAAVYRTAGHPDSYYYAVNEGATRHLLASAARHGVERSVIVSTAGVHGHVSSIPADETAPFNPGDVYQASKLAGEKVAHAAIAEGQPVSIVRPTGIYGPGDMRYCKMFRMIHRRKFIMFGSGRTYHHMSHVHDLADGIILCGEHPAAAGQVFIIGSDEYATLNDLTRLIADAVGAPPPRLRFPMWPLLTAAKVCESVCVPLRIEPPLHTRRCEFFIKDRAFTVRKARQMLGFAPKVPLAQGLRATAAWYFSQGLLTGEPPAATREAMQAMEATPA